MALVLPASMDYLLMRVIPVRREISPVILDRLPLMSVIVKRSVNSYSVTLNPGFTLMRHSAAVPIITGFVSPPYMTSKRVDRHGNRFRYRAKVRDEEGAHLGRWAWGVFLIRQ